MEKWVVTAKRADYNKIADKFSIDPVLARVMRNRGVEGMDAIEAYLHGGKEGLYSPWRLKDMDRAVDILQNKIREGANIRIIGDYDIDGIMSAYILEKGLTRAGAHVDVMIPDRIADGYGLNERLIVQAQEAGTDTIVTCDNGITAFAQIEKAKEMGMTVIVTDHHELLEGELPKADAVVNPKRPDCGYPFKGLCGAAVAYKLIEACHENAALPKEDTEQLLEYAAFATIGDVMDLVDENRILVKEGMKLLRRTGNPGLRELMRVNNIEPRELSAYHIGFVLGPCLNASGRLDTALRALELLRCTDAVSAGKQAGDLKNLNDSRKALTLKGVEQAVSQVEETGMREDKVYVIYLPDCHESLAGIIAGRIRELYHHPVFVLTRGEDGVKGSGRSIETYPMFDAMVACKGLFTHFGGHKMAAGLSMEEENIERLRSFLNDTCPLDDEDFIPKITIDVPMPMNYVTKGFIGQLELLEPFGKGNAKPVFAQKGLKALSYRIIGKNKNVISMRLDGGNGKRVDAVCFGEIGELEKILKEGREFAAVYYPNLNRYNGNESIQMVISHCQ